MVCIIFIFVSKYAIFVKAFNVGEDSFSNRLIMFHFIKINFWSYCVDIDENLSKF